MKSKYDGYYGDRVWDWKCHKVAPSPLIDCSWSPYINNWKQDITYMCPKNKFMAGELHTMIIFVDPNFCLAYLGFVHLRMVTQNLIIFG